MNEETPSRVKEILFSIVMGMVLGILMSGILVFLIRYSDYKMYSISFWLILIVACVLPLCFDFLEKRGFSLWIVELIMIGISFVIVLLYVRAISISETTNVALTRLTMVYHISSLCLNIVRLFVLRGIHHESN
ncbi:MAG: hypothetical protein IKE51_04695 [Solobacterium sp.]|nr:hypothetical protein [Solobacterium sp.]